MCPAASGQQVPSIASGSVATIAADTQPALAGR